MRIFIPMWLLILAVIPIESWLTGRFEPVTIVANVVGFGWARPFCVLGHLWYITMLMLLYSGFIVFSNFRLDIIKWPGWIGALALLLAVTYVMQDYLTTFSKAGPALFLFFGALMFAKGDEVIKKAKRHNKLVVVFAFAMLCVSMYVYLLGWHDSHKALAVTSFIMAGTGSFVAMYSCMNVTKEYKVIAWLAGLSYEIYLVHMPIIPLTAFIADNPFFRLFVGIVFTIILAVALNVLSKKIVIKLR